MITTQQQLETAVERGAKLLDDSWPGWYNLIDLGCMTFLNTHFDVLGQLGITISDRPVPHFEAAQALGLATIQAEVRHGFLVPSSVGQGVEADALLDPIWIEQIELRRAVKCGDAE